MTWRVNVILTLFLWKHVVSACLHIVLAAVFETVPSEGQTLLSWAPTDEREKEKGAMDGAAKEMIPP